LEAALRNRGGQQKGGILKGCILTADERALRIVAFRCNAAVQRTAYV